MTRRAIGVSERPPLLQTIPLSLQHLFAMFGATVLVPVLFHINPATVLLFNGIGTLLYLFICKGKIPAYLGSSFAFISPVLLLLPLGYEVALGGLLRVLTAPWAAGASGSGGSGTGYGSGRTDLGQRPFLHS